MKGWGSLTTNIISSLKFRKLVTSLYFLGLILLSTTLSEFRMDCCSVVSNSLWPHGLRHTRLPCPSPSPRACSNSRPLSWWCHPTIHYHPLLLPSVFPSIKVFSNELALCIRWPKYCSFSSASILPLNIQGWFSLGWTGLIFLMYKGLSRVFSTTVQKHRFFCNSAFMVQSGLSSTFSIANLS